MMMMMMTIIAHEFEQLSNTIHNGSGGCGSNKEDAAAIIKTLTPNAILFVCERPTLNQRFRSISFHGCRRRPLDSLIADGARAGG